MSIDDAAELAQAGFARIPWAKLGDDGERRLADRGVSVRCLCHPDGTLTPESGDDTEAILARAY